MRSFFIFKGGKKTRSAMKLVYYYCSYNVFSDMHLTETL